MCAEAVFIPVEAVYQSQSYCAEVSRISNHSGVQRVVSQIHRTGESLRYVFKNTHK